LKWSRAKNESKISSPAYYKECLDAWSELNGKTPALLRLLTR